MTTVRASDDVACRFFHGPFRLPLDDIDTPAQGGSYRPFHGIVSQGLRTAAPDGLTALSWPRLSVPLDRAIDGDPDGRAAVPGEVLEAAVTCGVLSFARSARCAGMYVRGHLETVWEAAGVPCPLDRCTTVALWNIKEGHTSSVWQASCEGPDGEPLLRFAINVARDSWASQELIDSARVLARLGAATADRRLVARVLDVRQLAPDFGPVAVVAQSWLDDALELGLTPTGDGGCRFVAIDRFLNSDSEPGRVTGVLGRVLTDEESLQVVEAMTTLVLRGAVWGPSGASVTLPAFEIRRGDWTWAGGEARLVAVSGQGRSVSPAEVLGTVVTGLIDDQGVLRDQVDRVVRTVTRVATTLGWPAAGDGSSVRA